VFSMFLSHGLQKKMGFFATSKLRWRYLFGN
jgi:hypothetical protein